MIEQIHQDADDRMRKSLEKFRDDLRNVRSGRATPSILESVQVEYYGSRMPLSQIASVSAPQPRLLVVQVWDKGAVQAVVKGIQAADLGLNPADDGEIIRVQIPPLTEQRRREIVKRCKKTTEETKVSIRNIRRDGNEALQKGEKEKEISEDNMHRAQKEIQKLTDSYIEKLDEAFKAKETEILEA
ncbi:MAG: ribosome recycling factor [Candidatus Eisenbacteria sp.]|nr:ribosome recycling factor [Candidatus Eisenbacteria bacterium]